MIEPLAEAEQQAPACACPWLDYARGPRGDNHPSCRLTSEIFAPGPLNEAACLQLCAYPAQHRRPRCKHLDLTVVIPSTSEPFLPRIVCRAHHNFDAPTHCASCNDYSPLE